MMAGRGFGKTRAGAEWVRSIAESDGSARIALVGATLHEARSVMVEGESGLLAIAAQGERPVYAPSLRRLVWRSGLTPRRTARRSRKARVERSTVMAGRMQSRSGPPGSHRKSAEEGT